MHPMLHSQPTEHELASLCCCLCCVDAASDCFTVVPSFIQLVLLPTHACFPADMLLL
jgi:hypothetical protein